LSAGECPLPCSDWIAEFGPSWDETNAIRRAEIATFANPHGSFDAIFPECIP